MAEIAPLERHICTGCGRNFDSKADVAPTRIGNVEHKFCRRCFRTATGVGYPMTFESAQADRDSLASP